MQKIGIVAGSGALPYEVMSSCEKNSIPFAICNFENETDNKYLLESNHQKLFKVHEVSKVIQFLKEQNVTHVTFAGKIKRTEIKRLLVDSKGIKLFSKIIKNGLADNAVLTAVIQLFEDEGFKVLPPEKIAQNLLVEKGVLTKIKPSQSAYEDIQYGLKILKTISSLDIGQGLIVQNKLILGVEAAEGTDELIKRCHNLQDFNLAKPILIKISKPTQDKRIDLPTIGTNTIKQAIEFGIGGIATEAESSIFMDREKALEIANQNKIFILGV